MEEELTGLLTDWGVSKASIVIPAFCAGPRKDGVAIQ